MAAPAQEYFAEKASHSLSGTTMEGPIEPEPETRPRQRLRIVRRGSGPNEKSRGVRSRMRLRLQRNDHPR